MTRPDDRKARRIAEETGCYCRPAQPGDLDRLKEYQR